MVLSAYLNTIRFTLNKALNIIAIRLSFAYIVTKIELAHVPGIDLYSI